MKSNILANGSTVEEHNQPQWRSISIASTGNGVAAYSFVTSPTRQNFSTDAINEAKIKEVKNNGLIEGKVELKTGNRGTFTYVNSYGSGNGISLSSYSDNNVGHKTITTLENIYNSGNIRGYIKQEAGENTSSGWHEYSNSHSYGSANGISLFSRSSNAKNEESESHIGKLNNTGTIEGKLYSKAGIGNGLITNISESSGNGVAVYLKGGIEKKVIIDEINNKGKISGSAIIYGGKDVQAAYSGKEEKQFFVDINEESITGEKTLIKKEEKLDYKFSEKEIKKGTEIFEKNKKIYIETISNKLDDVKEELKYSEEELKKQKENMQKYSILLNKINEEYAPFLDKSIESKKKEIEKKKDDIKWSYGGAQKLLEENLKTLETELEKLEEDKKVYFGKAGIEKHSEILIQFYDNKISILEEELDKLDEDKINKLKNKEYTPEHLFEANMKKIKERQDEIKSKIKKIEEELKTEEIQNLLTVTERKELLEARIKYLELLKIQTENMENVMNKSDHVNKTIQTGIDIIASGNGISIQHDVEASNNRRNSAQLKKFKNEGSISGYTEVYRGNDNESYSRVSFKKSGAGLVVAGKIKNKIENAGIISGSEFALLSEGTYDKYGWNPKRKFQSGFLGGVENNGILAGRAIIAGYKLNSQLLQDYEYFETINNDKNYINKGMFIVIDKNKEIVKVIVDDSKAGSKYQEYDIVNIKDIDGKYNVKDKKITKKIINGVGKEGVIQVAKGEEIELNNNIINGYYNAIKLNDDSKLILRNTILNVNGFGDKSYSILGNDSNNEVTIYSDVVLNGKVDLGKGNDQLTMIDANLSNTINLGEGNENSLVLKNEKMKNTKDLNENKYIFTSNIENGNILKIYGNVELKENSRISGLEKVEVEKGNKLIYSALGKDNQPFYNLKNKDGEIGIIEKKGDGAILIKDLEGISRVENTKDLFGWKLMQNGKDISYLESEKIYNVRNKIGMSFNELIEMISGKSIKMYDTESILTNIYKNPYAAYPYFSSKVLSNVHKVILDTGEFISKDKTDITLQNWKENISIDKYNSNFKIIDFKANYGMKDNMNIEGNIGIGEGEIFGNSLKLKSKMLVSGINLKMKNNNFVWTNGVLYTRNKPKDSKDINNYGIYSEIKYKIPISSTWNIIPRASFLLGKMSRKSERISIKNKEKKEVGNINIPKTNYHYSEFDFDLSTRKIVRVNHHLLSFEVGTGYSMYSQIKSSKILQEEKQIVNEWKWDSPKNKNLWNIYTGIKYKNENGISLEFKIQKNQIRKKNINFGIGYSF